MMNHSILNELMFDPAYIIIGMGALIIILLIVMIVCIKKINNMYQLYDLFMRGKDAETLEDAILDQFEDIKALKAQDRANKDEIKMIKKTLQGAFQKVGMVKYDAFKGMGGQLSFSLAMLNMDNTGFVLNSIHSREGCYTYIKEVTNGETLVVLSNEERAALEQALS